MPRSSTTPKLGVCLLASHPLVLNEFHRLLSHPPFHVQAMKVQAVITDSKSISIPRAGVYVVDYEGNSAATSGLVSTIVRRFPNARILIVGSRFDDRTAFPLLRMGVKGLMEHRDLSHQLDRALQSVADGGYWVSRPLLSRFVVFILKKSRPHLPFRPPTELSRREKEVVDALLENLSNKEIASRLNISERTVKFHVSNVLQKFGVGRRADLIVLGYQESSRPIELMSRTATASSPTEMLK